MLDVGWGNTISFNGFHLSGGLQSRRDSPVRNPAKAYLPSVPCQMAALCDFAANHRGSLCLGEGEGLTHVPSAEAYVPSEFSLLGHIGHMASTYQSRLTR